MTLQIQEGFLPSEIIIKNIYVANSNILLSIILKYLKIIDIIFLCIDETNLIQPKTNRVQINNFE